MHSLVIFLSTFSVLFYSAHSLPSSNNTNDTTLSPHYHARDVGIINHHAWVGFYNTPHSCGPPLEGLHQRPRIKRTDCKQYDRPGGKDIKIFWVRSLSFPLSSSPFSREDGHKSAKLLTICGFGRIDVSMLTERW